MLNTESHSNASTICLSCGLCCDGSLIGFVQLEKDELASVKQVMEIEEEGGTGFFLQPCKMYCHGCTIYADRPKNCEKFNCGLLKSVQEDELSFRAALDIIEEVKQQKQQIESTLTKRSDQLESQSFYFKIVELKQALKKKKKARTLTPSDLELIRRIAILDVLLSNKFGLTLD